MVSVDTVQWSYVVRIETVQWSNMVSVETVQWSYMVSVDTAQWSYVVSVETVQWSYMVSVDTAQRSNMIVFKSTATLKLHIKSLLNASYATKSLFFVYFFTQNTIFYMTIPNLKINDKTIRTICIYDFFVLPTSLKKTGSSDCIFSSKISIGRK